MLVITHEELVGMEQFASHSRSNVGYPQGRRLHFIGTYVDTEHALAIDVVYDVEKYTEMHWMVSCNTARITRSPYGFQAGHCIWVPPYLFRAAEEGYAMFMDAQYTTQAHGVMGELVEFLDWVQLPLSIGGLTKQPKNLRYVLKWRAKQCAYMVGVIQWACDQDTFKRLGVSHRD